MKKIYLSATMALFLAATSCQNEEVVESVQNGREFRVEVSVGSSSRTDIGEDGTMTWSEGDQIYVGNLSDGTTGGVLTLVSGAGSAKAVFAGIVTGSGNLEYSVFPVPNADGVIDLTTRKAGQSNAPLISTFDSNNPGELSFEKTCGVVRIEVSGEKGGELTLNTETGTNQKHLGGVAKVVKNGDKFELQYTRGNGGVTITDLPEDGTIDVPVITEAVKENGAQDNLPDGEQTFVVEVNDKEVEFEAEVETGAVTANDVPSVDMEESGELIAYTSISTIDEFNALINDSENKEVAVKLTKDLVIDISAWVEPYYIGHENTSKIYIDGDGNTLNFNNNNTDWNYIRCRNEEAKWFIKNVNLTNSGKNDGPWNRHDIRFYNAVELTDVNSDKAIALLNDATLTRVNIADVHPNNSEAYALWITTQGQTVTVVDCDFTAHSSKTTDRGIAIKEQYVDEPAKVTLNVSGSTFVTQKKAAVLVTSSVGATINWGEGNDISKVAADSKNAVWVDKITPNSMNLMTVTGCSYILEP